MENIKQLSKAEMKNVMGGALSPEECYVSCVRQYYDPNDPGGLGYVEEVCTSNCYPY